MITKYCEEDSLILLFIFVCEKDKHIFKSAQKNEGYSLFFRYSLLMAWWALPLWNKSEGFSLTKTMALEYLVEILVDPHNGTTIKEVTGRSFSDNHLN